MLQKSAQIINVQHNDFSQPEHTCRTNTQIQKQNAISTPEMPPLIIPPSFLPAKVSQTSFAIVLPISEHHITNINSFET